MMGLYTNLPRSGGETGGAGEDVPAEIEEELPERGESVRQGVKAAEEKMGAKRAGPKTARDAPEGTATTI